MLAVPLASVIAPWLTPATYSVHAVAAMLSEYVAESVSAVFCVAVVGVIAPTAGAVVSLETTSVLDAPLPTFPDASVHFAWIENDPLDAAVSTYVAVPLVDELPSVIGPTFAPEIYMSQLATPTASEYVAETVVATPTVATSGDTTPTVGATTSAVATTTVAVAPTCTFAAASVHTAYADPISLLSFGVMVNVAVPLVAELPSVMTFVVGDASLNVSVQFVTPTSSEYTTENVTGTPNVAVVGVGVPTVGAVASSTAKLYGAGAARNASAQSTLKKKSFFISQSIPLTTH